MSTDPIDQLRALAHPLRLQILSLLTGTAMSAAEVARETGTTQANASYHLRRLHEVGQIVLTEEVVLRGGRARRFRYDPSHVVDVRRDGGTTRPTSPGAVPAAVPAAGPVAVEAQLVAEAYAGELVRRAAHQLGVSPSTATDAELWVDPEVWATAVTRIAQVSKLLHRAARPPRTPGTVRTSTTVAMFLMDPTARPAPFGDEEPS